MNFQLYESSRLIPKKKTEDIEIDKTGSYTFFFPNLIPTPATSKTDISIPKNNVCQLLKKFKNFKTRYQSLN